MNDPVKLIYKYKNLNKRTQYQLFIFLGYMVNSNIKNILEKIKDLNFYDSLMELSVKDYEKLQKVYGEFWFKNFFTSEHLELGLNLIEKTPQKKKEIEKKFGKEWLSKIRNLNIFGEKMMYSYQYLFKKERELKERSKNLREKQQEITEDYTTKKIQIGGDEDEQEDIDLENAEDDDADNTNTVIDNNDLNNADEFDLEELENMYQTNDFDENVETTSKLIDKIMKSDEKNITSKNKLVDFPNDKDNVMYDDSIKNVYKKIYIYEQYIFKDDTIKKIKEKISCSIKLNNIFEKSGDVKHNAYLTPSRLYLWSKYDFIDQEDNNKKTEQVMLGQKWIKRSEMLKIDIEPNENLKIYQELRGDLKFLKQDMRKYGSRIRREEDEFKLLEDYDKYIQNNEIYLIDIFNELGINNNINPNKLKNLYDIYIKIYFFHINSDEFKQIVNYLDIKDEQNRKFEINQMKSIYQTLNNDLILENEIIKTVEDVNMNNEEVKDMFKDNHITHSVIHAYVSHSNTFNSSIIDLFRVFDNFKMTEEYPFLQYQLIDGKMVYKFYSSMNETDKSAIMAKWFENSPYGISFKIKANQKGGSSNKYIALSLNENGRLEYKIQWKEDDNATVEDIRRTYVYIRNLLEKINSENTKLKINIPKDKDFIYAFINSIQKFEFKGKKSINHNDLSEFCRYFYPYISLVIEPRKRNSSLGRADIKSKFGTYLRYKRVSKYENEAKIEHRIIYFMKNYEYTDSSLIKEIAKQFNITEKQSAEKIENVKKKYPVIKKSRKVLKRLESAPKYNHPGIGIDIQGKSRQNYKIRISGARNKSQLDRIIKFMNILIYLYIETYLNKNKDYQKLKDKLKDLVNIAKRRNKVDEIVDLEDVEVKTVKKITKFDSDRLGYRPEDGESHWTRSCQNSGTKKRQPQQYVYSSLDELLKKGYKFNEKSKYYEKTVKVNKKEVVLRAAELVNLKDKGNNLFYVCDPEDNNEYMYVGFLSRSKNPNDLCMPCCFKKDPLESKNQDKKNYYLKCMGKLKDVEFKKKKVQTDKIYILQDTNKIQEGRFGFLPEILDFFLNKLEKFNVNIKNHYLINTKPYYLFKYGVKLSNHPFLESLGNIYDIPSDDIKNKLIEIIENDKKNILFTSLNSGDIKTQFKTREIFVDFLKNNNYLEYDILGDFISKPGIMSSKGINFYIFEKNTIVIKKLLEKKTIRDDYNIICSNLEDDIYRNDDARDNIIMLKDGKTYYPIFIISKKNINTNAVITKIYKKDNLIDKCLNFYKLGCNKETDKKFKKGISYSCKFINYELNNIKDDKFKPKSQIIDLRNKCRYILLNNNILIPTYPSGTLHDINILDKIDDFVYDLDKTVNNLLLIDSKIELDYKPIGFLYTEYNSNKYKVVAFILNNDIEVRIKPELVLETDILKIAKAFKRKTFKKKNVSQEDIIDEFISNKKNVLDDRITDNKERLFDKESYQLFRLELSQYLNINTKLKEKIIKILENNKLKSKEMKNLLKPLLFKYINRDLYQILQSGGNEKYLLELDDKEINYVDYKIKNKRDLCKTNITKEGCNNNKHCKWKSNTCKLLLTPEKAIIFTNKVIQELIKDDMKSKEILTQDNYYVSDIVDMDNFTQRRDEEIIKSDIPNINKILSQIFGEDNIPIIGKRKFYKMGKSINEENNDNPIEKFGKIYSQNIICNNNTNLRAFSNSFYWLNNNLYDIEVRNLGYYSDLQTDLSNYFRGNIIDFLIDNSNRNYINDVLSTYLSVSTDIFIQELSGKNNTLYNGRVELLILSKLFNTTIITINNYYDIFYLFINGDIVYDEKYKINNSKDINFYKKDEQLKKSIVIMFDFNFGSNNPSKVKSIYY